MTVVDRKIANHSALIDTIADLSSQNGKYIIDLSFDIVDIDADIRQMENDIIRITNRLSDANIP